jgi:glyoxylase-like metal-dependent hydrolase (beta-lactamase superfamily II)
MMGLGVRRVVPLTLGWVDVPKSVSVDGASGEVLREPVPAVLLDCDGGWLLLDTGFNTALITDPALRARFHPGPVEQPVLPGPGEPLLTALGAAGLDLADIRAVAISHLHYDHAGGLKHVAGRVPVHIQRAELAYGLSSPPGPEENGIFRVDFDDPRIDWRQADGDTEIAPGVTAVRTAGHTPGHQSFVVRMAAGGGFVFAFDAADLTENIDREVAVGGRIGASAADSVGQIRKLKRIAADQGYRLVPGHDPDVWPALTAELAWLSGETLDDPVGRGHRQHLAGTEPSRGQQCVILGAGPFQPTRQDQHVQVADQHRHGRRRVGRDQPLDDQYPAARGHGLAAVGQDLPGPVIVPVVQHVGHQVGVRPGRD